MERRKYPFIQKSNHRKIYKTACMIASSADMILACFSSAITECDFPSTRLNIIGSITFRVGSEFEKPTAAM